MSADSGEVLVLFLDANVLISAAWKDAAEVAQIWNLKNVRLVTSNYVLGEVQRNLNQASQIDRLRVLMRTVQVLFFEDLPGTPKAPSLPAKDQPVLAGAIAAQADHLVSGDKKHFGPLFGVRISGVRITSPPELLRVLRHKLP